jgi:plasmid stability protein
VPQLVVRNIEPWVVKELRSRAAAQGVSMEEAHRRLLRSALIGNGPKTAGNFIEYLRSIPQADEVEFGRSADLPRLYSLKAGHS